MSEDRLCVFGEVLFDHFPNGERVLGGAPFNVAWHLQAFGCRPRLFSRVGDDPEGAEIRAAMRAWDMDPGGLQTDPRLPTGRVEVSFHDGEPSYDIVRPCAYDAISAPADGADCRLLYHGSLALREPPSRLALKQLKACGPALVFVDVNLRPPWWQRDALQELLLQANWVKLNGDELGELGRSAHAEPLDAAGFLSAYALDGLIVTHGSRGAELLTRGGERYTVRPQRATEVVDTVGAGDGFASVIILGLSLHWPLDLTLQRAQAFASRIVASRGATVRDRRFYQPFIDEWKLAI